MNALISDCFDLSKNYNIPNNRYENLPPCCHPQSPLLSDSTMNFLEDRKKRILHSTSCMSSRIPLEMFQKSSFGHLPFLKVTAAINSHSVARVYQTKKGYKQLLICLLIFLLCNKHTWHGNFSLQKASGTIGKLERRARHLGLSLYPKL